MVKPEIPDTRYDYTHPWWNNMNDRVAWERSFQQGDFEDRQIAQAMIVSNPVTSNAEISEKMTANTVPSRFGYNDSEITIRDVLDDDRLDYLADAHTTDFSGRLSNIEPASRPGIYW